MFKAFLRNTSHSTIGQAAVVVSGLAQSVILARILGPENRGVLALVLLLPGTVHALLASGLPPTVVHSIAAGSWKDNIVIPRLLGLCGYLSVAMLAAAIPAIHFRELLFPNAPLALLLLGVPLMPLTLLEAGLLSVFTGKQRFRQQMMLRILASILGLGSVALFVWFLRWGPAGALVAQLVAATLSLLLAGAGAARILTTEAGLPRPDLTWRSVRDALGFGGMTHLSNLVTFLNYRADQFLVNGMVGSSGLGVYTVAVNNAEKLWLLVGNFAAVLFPMASARQDDPTVLAKFTAQVAAHVLWAMMAVGLLLALLAKPLVVLLYGRDFAAAASAIVYLVPGIVMLCHAKITANYITGCGYPGRIAAISLLALALNIAANIVLIPRAGIVGAALATTLSYSFVALLCFLVFARITALPWRRALVPDLSGLARLAGWASRRAKRMR